MAAEEKDKSFKVRDRRVLNEEGDADEPESADSGDTAAAAENQPREKAGKTGPGAARAQTEMPLPEINFSTFVASLNASVLVNLGIIADPATGEKEKNLTMAKQTIDIMSMLQEKTKGNLNKDEESMLKSILYDLRLMYVREKG